MQDLLLLRTCKSLTSISIQLEVFNILVATFKSQCILEYSILRSTSQNALHLRRSALRRYTQFQETAIDVFGLEKNSGSSGDDKVIGDSQLTKSSFDSDFEIQMQNKKIMTKVQRDNIQLFEVVEQQKIGGISSTCFTK